MTISQIMVTLNGYLRNCLFDYTMWQIVFMIGSSSRGLKVRELIMRREGFIYKGEWISEEVHVERESEEVRRFIEREREEVRRWREIY